LKLPDPGLMKEATSLTMIFSKIRTGTSGRYQFLVMVWTDPVFIRKQVPNRQIGEIKMPCYTFKHLWTPLEWVGIKLYRNITEDSLWIKVGARRRRPLKPGNTKGYQR